MALTLPFMSLQMTSLDIETGKAHYHRMFLQHVHFLLSSAMSLADGREVLQTARSLKMLDAEDSMYQMESFIWQMQVFLSVMH